MFVILYIGIKEDGIRVEEEDERSIGVAEGAIEERGGIELFPLVRY